MASTLAEPSAPDPVYQAPSGPLTRTPERRPLSAAPAPPRPGFGRAEVHGLRNPLAGVRATVQLAQMQSCENPEVAALLGDALAEVDRLDDRIRALLTLHQPEEPKPRTIDLTDLLESVTRALESRCESQGITLSWQIDAALRRIETDPDLLEECLLELAQNALRASAPGGALSFRASQEPGHVEIRVSDTGSGIPAAVRGRVFDPFFTTRRDGTGLGLASTRRRLGEAGGSLALESSSEAGSCFRICLPHPA